MDFQFLKSSFYKLLALKLGLLTGILISTTVWSADQIGPRNTLDKSDNWWMFTPQIGTALNVYEEGDFVTRSQLDARLRLHARNYFPSNRFIFETDNSITLGSLSRATSSSNSAISDRLDDSNVRFLQLSARGGYNWNIPGSKMRVATLLGPVYDTMIVSDNSFGFTDMWSAQLHGEIASYVNGGDQLVFNAHFGLIQSGGTRAGAEVAYDLFNFNDRPVTARINFNYIGTNISSTEAGQSFDLAVRTYKSSFDLGYSF